MRKYKSTKSKRFLTIPLASLGLPCFPCFHWPPQAGLGWAGLHCTVPHEGRTLPKRGVQSTVGIIGLYLYEDDIYFKTDFCRLIISQPTKRKPRACPTKRHAAHREVGVSTRIDVIDVIDGRQSVHGGISKECAARSSKYRMQ